jgi:hypothetical protein
MAAPRRVNRVSSIKENFMFSNYVFAFSVLSLLVMGQPGTVRAADSCQPVFDALTKLITTSSHSYSTGVVNGKPTSTETIYVQGKTYIFARGKWMVSPATPADVLTQELEDEKEGKSTCQFVRNESVNGEAAGVYSLRRETETRKEDGQMWISKLTGRALREEVAVDYGGSLGKGRLSARFEYSNVKAPI